MKLQGAACFNIYGASGFFVLRHDVYYNSVCVEKKKEKIRALFYEVKKKQKTISYLIV